MVVLDRPPDFDCESRNEGHNSRKNVFGGKRPNRRPYRTKISSMATAQLARTNAQRLTKTNTLVRLPSGERLCECFRYNICWYVARDYVRVPDGSGRERKRVETTAFKGRDELTEQTLGLCLGLDVRASNCWLALTLVLSRYKRHDELQKHQAYKKTQNSSKYIKELL